MKTRSPQDLRKGGFAALSLSITREACLFQIVTSFSAVRHATEKIRWISSTKHMSKNAPATSHIVHPVGKVESDPRDESYDGRFSCFTVKYHLRCASLENVAAFAFAVSIRPPMSATPAVPQDQLGDISWNIQPGFHDV